MHLLLGVSKAHICTRHTHRYTPRGRLTLPDVDMIGGDRCMGQNSLHKVK